MSVSTTCSNHAALFFGGALLLYCLVAGAAPPVVGPESLAVAVKASSCNACHGPAGNSEAGLPPLAGRNAETLYGLLLSFKNGTRSAMVMHQHAKGYSDDELRDIAAYFSRQQPGRGQ